MKYIKATWIGDVKQAIADLKTDKPTGGQPTAIAGVRYNRDGYINGLGLIETKDGKNVMKDGKPVFTKVSWTSEDVYDALKSEASELIKQLSTEGVDDGFMSNASAAAKAAGFKSSTEKTLELVD